MRDLPGTCRGGTGPFLVVGMSARSMRFTRDTSLLTSELSLFRPEMGQLEVC